MGYNFQKQIDFLLENACAGIRYLIFRDMLDTPVNEPFMKTLQMEILQQANVQKHFEAQQPDGWFGHELHGNDGMDCHIGGLLNAGVEPDNLHIQKAITALMAPEIASQHKNWFRGGDALDAEGRGGNRAIIADILSWVGTPEDTPVLCDEIARSLGHLKAVLQYNSVDDFSVKGKKERYYKPKAKFPGANHIGLLAGTQSWRTEANMQIAKSAITHGYELMKNLEENITFRKPAEFGGGFVGPFNYNWQALSPIKEEQLWNIVENPYPFQFGFWLRAVSGTPDWVRQSTTAYELLADALDKDALFDRIPDKTLKAFKQIMGREPNWRKKTAAKCDVTYAVLRACWPVLK